MSDADREYLKRAVKALLKKHVGPANAVRMTQVFITVTGETVIPWRRHEQTRPIRSIVQQLRNEGCPIGINRGGYFWAESDDQLGNTLGKLHKSAMTNLKTEAALKKITFGELLKQYELEFKQEKN